jgi:hypothetical protein
MIQGVTHVLRSIFLGMHILHRVVWTSVLEKHIAICRDYQRRDIS